MKQCKYFFLTCLHITQHLFSRSKTYFFQNKYTETCCTSIKSTPSDFFSDNLQALHFSPVLWGFAEGRGK